MAFNVLISSAGRRVALLRAFRAALEELGLEGRVLAADMSPLAAAFHDADAGFVVPRCTDPQFVPALLRLCAEQNVRVVIPTIDTELPVYAAAREQFESIGARVAVSSPEVVAIGGDKLRTHEWLVANAFPTVRQTTPREVIHAPGAWRYPLIVKPRGGSSSIGVAIVRDEAELVSATRGGDYIVQTVATGAEHTIDVLASRGGECVCAVPRRRFETRAGEVSKGMTVRSAELEGLAARICAALPGAYGTLNVQVFRDEGSGALNVIELNARFGGGYPLSWAAGARYPTWIIEELLGRPSTASRSGWRDGLVMLRFDDAVFVDSRAAGVAAPRAAER